MTVHSDAPADYAPVSQIVEVDGIPMSALLAEARQPRAVIVALHGGATDSAYFDCPGHPRLSLLRTAAGLGYTVLALDRPGYGSSMPYRDELAAPQRRLDLAYAAVERHLGSRPRGAGVFLWAHSVGCELATRMAADERGAGLLGIELAGTGRVQHAAAQAILGSTGQKASPSDVYDLLWTPTELYPPELVGGASIASRTPSYEGGVTAAWPRDNFPALAAAVRIPVHFTAGDHEKVWRNDHEALNDVAAMFTAAPRVELNHQADSGHNLSLGYTATAYHAKVLSFVEECIRARADEELPSRRTEFDNAVHAAAGEVS
ncbi:MAG: alpha/beta hydrolase family protein [Rhodococcus sp. (in: high G+C Gram-positive bacteria)]|uniref:alpha/beta hydrolase n=1 Tax=Rhodococcus sp. TaxID=1831 RepID=UPI003BAE2408